MRRSCLFVHNSINRPRLYLSYSSYSSYSSFLRVNRIFTIIAEIHARSLANFYCQYADRHMSLKFMGGVSEREPAIWQFVIVKNKLMSVFNASVLLLITNFVHFDNVMTKFMINNRTEA